MASIQLKQLRKSFGAVEAVAGIDLEIADRQFVALLGPSGCGKTTTLRMISGLELPTSGTIIINDRDVTRLPPRERDVAMVFQDYALYPHMTILDNIGYPLKVRGVPRSEIEQRVKEVAHNLQIGGLLERRPSQLSGGQQQRVAVARAVVHRAQVFLFDEPLSNLDAKLRLEARAFLKHLQQKVGITSVYVTHDQSEAMALADIVVVMREGRIMQADKPLNVYNQPVNTFVASFIGNPPMNLLPCTVEPKSRRLHIQTGEETQTLVLPDFIPPAGITPTETLTLGIRPEYVEIETAPTSSSTDLLLGELYVIQPLGGETLVLVKLGEHLVTARLFGDQLAELPHRLGLRLQTKYLFFYDSRGDLIT